MPVVSVGCGQAGRSSVCEKVKEKSKQRFVYQKFQSKLAKTKRNGGCRIVNEKPRKQNDPLWLFRIFWTLCSWKLCKFDRRCPPWTLRTHQHAHLQRNPLQHDHLPKPDGPHQPGWGQRRSLSIFPPHQSQLLRRHSTVPLLHVRTCLHHSRPTPTSLQVPLWVCPSVWKVDDKIWISVAGKFRVQQVSGGRWCRRAVCRPEPWKIWRSGAGTFPDNYTGPFEAIRLFVHDGFYMPSRTQNTSRPRI